MLTRKAVRILLAISFLAAAPIGFSQARGPGLRTVSEVNGNPTGFPPHGGTWSPDSRLYTFIATDSLTLNGNAPIGNPGDIVQIDATTGQASVLASVAQLSSLSSAAINEKDLDHRARYSMSSFLWADDSRHLMLDNGGRLWLYDIATGTGKLIVDTGAGSGDDPKFSPDARSVSYLRNHNLYVHPVGVAGAPEVAGASEVALTSTKADSMLNGEVDWVYLEELEVRSNYFWSPDSSAIAYLQMDESRVPQFPIVDWIPRHADVDMQRYPQPGDNNPTVRVGVVPAAGGPTHWIEVPFSAGNDYIPRFGWVDPRTVYVEVLTRDQQHLNLYFADVATGRTALVHSETDSKYLEDNYDVTMLPGGRFANTSWKDGHTHIYLYQFDSAHPLDREATLTKQLSHGDFEVTNLESHGGTLYYTSNEGNVLENNLWSIALDGSQKKRLTPAAGTHDPKVSPDGKHFIDLPTTGATPPVAALCGISGEVCTSYWKSIPIAPATGVTSARVSYLAADGRTTLYGILTQPSVTAGGASIPIILNPYGGPLPSLGLRNAWSPEHLFDELMAQHGFAVLALENRGQGGRGRDFQQAAYRNFGPVQFSDQIAALNQALAKNPQLDAKRVGWWGWSWGGAFTLYAMTHTDRIRAGVAVAPVTNFLNYDSIYTERYLGLPSASDSPYPADAAVTSATNLKGHLLLAQGTGDDNVHLSNIIQFIQPLIDAGIPYDLQLFPRKTHSLSGLTARDELFNRILAQFETYLK